jgi:hypothetical protein
VRRGGRAPRGGTYGALIPRIENDAAERNPATELVIIKDMPTAVKLFKQDRRRMQGADQRQLIELQD